MRGPARRRSWWGWGYEGEGLNDDEARRLGRRLGDAFGLTGELRSAPPVADVAATLPATRVTVPAALDHLVTVDGPARVAHSYGKAFRDVVRSLAGRIDHPPDAVARPTSEVDVAAVLDWAADGDLAVVPYGGGSSVVGGVEPAVGDGFAGAVSLDLGALDRLLELDTVSMAARLQAGVLGPALEDALKVHGLTLRHFPQSFECSSLGGWIATRAGGHFATGPTHIDDLVESLRVVTPSGIVQTRRLPGSGAGPSPDRLFLGSEGALGVITEAWMRVRPRPRWRAGGPVRFGDLFTGVDAARALAQSGLAPSNCRLIDPVEALVNGVGDGSAALLIVGFESADHPVGPWARRARELVADHGGVVDDDSWTERDSADPDAAGATSATAADSWRASFMRAPYVRDALVRLGAICETFETACTWDRFAELHATVTAAVRGALADVGAGPGFVTCRFTHVYPDGAAPYFSVIAPGRPGAELAQWDTVKKAASDAILATGGTITHHHAVGRDHRPWYDRQRPDLFAEVLAAAKDVLDPAGVMNPGVLVDARRAGPRAGAEG